MKLLDLLARPEELERVRPDDVPALLGELATWEAKIRMVIARSNGNSHTPIHLLTSEEVAEMLNVKAFFVEEKARRGEIKTVELGRYRRYRIEDVVDYVEAQRR